MSFTLGNFRFALAVLAVGCTRGEPPTWDAGTAGGPLAFGSARVPEDGGAPLPTASAAGDSGLVGRAAAQAVPPAPSASAATEPQTRDRPVASSPALDARAAALFAAIVLDDADRALPFFFPLAAYEQVKDVGNPARDWKIRLVAAYARDIHDLHLKLGKGATRATFLRLEVPESRVRWVEPHEEYNKLGYWRVFGSRLRYEVDGRERVVEITSLISWRGDWFVVHLSAMK